jgi:hypothetical protein
VEGAERLARHHRLLGPTGFVQGSLAVDQDVGAEAPVQPLDALQHGARDLDGGERAAADQPRQLDGGGVAEVGGATGTAP